MSANKNSASKNKAPRNKTGKRRLPKRTYFPKPTPALKDLVAQNMKVVAVEEHIAKEHGPLSTGNLPGDLPGNSRIQEVLVEPGVLFASIPDPAYPDEPTLKQHCDWRPSTYPNLLAAVEGYHGFLAQVGLADALRQYVIIFAHGDLYEDAPRHALLIRKPPDSPLHPGCLNFPGGAINVLAKEHPQDAAVREFYEETGWQVTFPQLMGVLLPSMYDFSRERPYLVYCYRGMLLTQAKQTAINEAHAAEIQAHDPKWYKITDLTKERIVPNLLAILPHLASESRCWLIQDCWRSDPDSLTNSLANMQACTQELITYYPAEFLEIKMGKAHKQRFTT